MIFKPICPNCGKKDSPVLEYGDFKLPYNMSDDSDYWMDAVIETEEDEGEAVISCYYCGFVGKLEDFSKHEA